MDCEVDRLGGDMMGRVGRSDESDLLLTAFEVLRYGR